MLRAFGDPVASCCIMLGVDTQHVTTHRNTVAKRMQHMLRPTMLGYVALACCDHLAGA